MYQLFFFYLCRNSSKTGFDSGIHSGVSDWSLVECMDVPRNIRNNEKLSGFLHILEYLQCKSSNYV